MWHDVGPASHFRAGRGYRVVLADPEEELALFGVDDRLCATTNVCPHQHTPNLHQGAFVGEWVTCPLHGWTFNVVSGATPNGGRGLRTYPVKIDGGRVFVFRAPDARFDDAP